jgi:Mitochondrial carrier protein
MYSSISIILKEEGLRGLFGGFSASIFGSMTGQTVYFGSYELVKRRMIDLNINPQVAYFVSGGLADVAASVLYVPSEVRISMTSRF